MDPEANGSERSQSPSDSSGSEDTKSPQSLLDIQTTPFLVPSQYINPSTGTTEKRLHISNIPFKWREDDLRQHFSRFGELKHIEVVYNEKGSKGFGFVTFTSAIDADQAIAEMSGQMVMGRTIEVSEATRRQRHHTTPFHKPPPAAVYEHTDTTYSSQFGALLLQQKQLLAQQQLQQYLITQQQSEMMATALGLPSPNIGGLLSGGLQYTPSGILPALTIDQQTLHQHLSLLQSLQQPQPSPPAAASAAAFTAAAARLAPPTFAAQMPTVSVSLYSPPSPYATINNNSNGTGAGISPEMSQQLAAFLNPAAALPSLMHNEINAPSSLLNARSSTRNVYPNKRFNPY